MLSEENPWCPAEIGTGDLLLQQAEALTGELDTPKKRHIPNELCHLLNELRNHPPISYATPPNELRHTTNELRHTPN